MYKNGMVGQSSLQKLATTTLNLELLIFLPMTLEKGLILKSKD